MSPRLTLFVSFSFAYFLSYFFRSANAVIAGDLQRDLALSAAQLGLMTSLFYAAFALVQLPLGIALDRFGARWVTPILMLAAVAGALLFAIAQQFAVLALGRALLGVGMAGVLMGALQVFARWFEPQRVATISGLLIGIGASGGLFAASPLAWLSQSFGWRAIFSWGALVILASALVIISFTRNTPPGVSLPAASSSQGGLGRVFSDLRFWRIAPLNFWILGTQLAVQGLWGGPYLFDVLGMDKAAAAGLLLLLSAGVVLGYTSGGWLADQFGSMRFTISCATLFVFCHLPLLLPGIQPAVWLVGLAYLVFGFTGTANVILLAQVRGLFPDMSGRALTAANLFGFSGTALVQWWMGLILSAVAPEASGSYPASAYAAAFGFTALGTLVSLLWYLPLALSQRRSHPLPATASPGSSLEV